MPGSDHNNNNNKNLVDEKPKHTQAILGKTFGQQN
jgi:hypothetical protein